MSPHSPSKPVEIGEYGQGVPAGQALVQAQGLDPSAQAPPPAALPIVRMQVRHMLGGWASFTSEEWTYHKPWCLMRWLCTLCIIIPNINIREWTLPRGSRWGSTSTGWHVHCERLARMPDSWARLPPTPGTCCGHSSRGECVVELYAIRCRWGGGG